MSDHTAVAGDQSTGGRRSALTALLGGNLRQYSMVIALVVLLIVFQITTKGLMITPSNFQNLITGNAYVLILAMGMLMVIVIGQIDLSVGSVAGFVGMVMAVTARDWGLPWWVAVLLGLVLGVLVGSWQGFWLAKLGIPGFITTLAGMMIFRGATLWISHSVTVTGPKQLRVLSSGYLPEWGPTFTHMNNSTLLLGLIAAVVVIVVTLRNRSHRIKASGSAGPVWATIIRLVVICAVIGGATWIFGSGRVGTSFPVVGLIVVVLILVYHTLTQRTAFGRNIYAVGGNKAAAALSGVNVTRTYFLTMVNISFLAAVAGILFVGRASSAGSDLGTGWELDAIAAVFIGGAAVSGGIGTIIGSIVGAMVMAVLNSGLYLMGVDASRTQVIKGLVLLAAVAFDVWNKQRGRKSIVGHLANSMAAANPLAPADPTTSPAQTAPSAGLENKEIPREG